MLPPPFARQMQHLLSEEYTAFVTALGEPAPVSIRLNPLKSTETPESVAGAAVSGRVPWHPEGLYLNGRPVFTLDPLLHAGKYYVQEASSMFLYEAVKQTLGNHPGPRILDLCAAPGGKSTLLSAFSGQNGLLVSNEYVRSRINPLRENIERWGTLAVAVTSADADAFIELNDWFDVVVVDAPCSGEGLFRKDPGAIREWSVPHVETCALRQQRILPGAVSALAPGGILVYSTCTYNQLENEDNVRWLCDTFGMERCTLQLPESWHISESEGGYRFFPHHVKGEGLFLSVLRKTEQTARRHNPGSGFQHLRQLPKAQIPDLLPWVQDAEMLRFYLTPQNDVVALPRAREADLLVLDKACNSKWFGTKMGAFKGRDFIPDHALALSEIVSKQLPALELTREEAQLFLKKETFDIPAVAARGWTLARYQGLNLGWMKILPNRMNNYLPPERRIRMELE